MSDGWVDAAQDTYVIDAVFDGLVDKMYQARSPGLPKS